MKLFGKRLQPIAIAALFLATFSGGCKKDTAFEKKGLCPEVLLTSPADKETAVLLNKTITVTFNEAMNAKTITSATFRIQGASKIEGTLTFDNESHSVSFTPASKL